MCLRCDIAVGSNGVQYLYFKWRLRSYVCGVILQWRSRICAAQAILVRPNACVCFVIFQFDHYVGSCSCGCSVMFRWDQNLRFSIGYFVRVIFMCLQGDICIWDYSILGFIYGPVM